jgi:hypothetical protein
MLCPWLQSDGGAKYDFPLWLYPSDFYSAVAAVGSRIDAFAGSRRQWLRN